jgi:hypothetical protein
MDLKDVQKLKKKAETYIDKIIKKVEKDTGLICTDILFYEDENNSYAVNLTLEVKNSLTLEEDKK